LNLLSLPISDIAELIDTLRSHRFVTAPEGIEIDGNICGSSAKHDKDQNRHQYSRTLRFIAAAYPGGTPTQTE
jgi:hypothetical protein